VFDADQSKFVFDVVDATLMYVVPEKYAEPAPVLGLLYGDPEYVKVP
jgi:hypothetical protein